MKEREREKKIGRNKYNVHELPEKQTSMLNVTNIWNSRQIMDLNDSLL